MSEHQLPAPLTPLECDLQDFPFMPLHVARLRDSDLAAEETAEACWYAVLLWAASWHQIPAASLPNNDAAMTRLIGLGKDVRTFRKHKVAALRHFVLCNDGRLYHPMVAEQAINAWNSKLQQRWRTECARIKKRSQRDKVDYPIPTFEQFLAGNVPGPGPDVSPGTGENVPEDSDDCPQGNDVQERGIGRGISIKPPNPPSGGVRSDRFAEGWGAYPIAGRGNHGPARSEAEWPAAVDRAGGEDALIGAIKAHAAQLAADGGRVKSFDRWLRDDGFAAYLGQPGTKPVTAWSGPQDIWQAVSRAMGEDQARGYLAQCRWQDGPVKAIIAPHEFAAGKLRSGAGAAIGGLGIQIIIEGERAA